MTFICHVSGNPTPNVTWFRGGQTIGTGGTLSFPVFRSQSGYYFCVADNDLNATVNASAYLEVHCKFKSVSEYLFLCTRLCRYGVIIYSVNLFRKDPVRNGDATGFVKLNFYSVCHLSVVAVIVLGSGALVLMDVKIQYSLKGYNTIQLRLLGL